MNISEHLISDLKDLLTASVCSDGSTPLDGERKLGRMWRLKVKGFNDSDVNGRGKSKICCKTTKERKSFREANRHTELMVQLIPLCWLS